MSAAVGKLVGSAMPALSAVAMLQIEGIVLVVIAARVLSFAISWILTPGTPLLARILHKMLGESVIKAPADGMVRLRTARRSQLNVYASAMLLCAAFVAVAVTPPAAHSHLGLAEAQNTSIQEVIENIAEPKKESDWVGMSKALMLIVLAEFGDKTFFVAMILAMKYDKWAVFAGSMAALIIMTVLSAGVGWFLVGVVDRVLLLWVGAVIYFAVGAWMLWDAYNMKDGGSAMEEAHEELEKEGLHEAFVHIFGGTDDWKQIGDEGGKPDGAGGGEGDAEKGGVGAHGGLRMGYWEIFIKAFVLNSVAEFGDRTQIATVVLCVDYNPVFVATGAIVAFFLVTAGAVFLGAYLSDKISERSLTFGAAVIFILFGFFSVLQLVVT